MFAFLSYPLVIEYSAFLFFMTFLLSLAATISNGYNQSVVTKFITITFTMGFGATSVLEIEFSAFLFFMTFLLSLAATISNGYNQSVVTKFITITFTMGFGATSVLVLKYGFDETTAMAYSLYGIIGVAVPVFVLWKLLQIRRFSAMEMESAYRKYDEYQEQGMKPVIVMTAYGPKVITEYT